MTNKGGDQHCGAKYCKACDNADKIKNFSAISLDFEQFYVTKNDGDQHCDVT